MAPLDQFIPESVFLWVEGRRELLCWTLWVVGAAIVGWAMRPRGRRAERRCSKCGYALAGLRGDVCPECGRAFAGAKAKRWRVRWKMATCGLMLLPAGWCVRNALDVHQRGWIALAPSIVLACVVEPKAGRADPLGFPEKGTAAEMEFWLRLVSDERGYDHCGNAPRRIWPRMPAWVRGVWLERWAAAANRRLGEDGRAGLMARVYSAQAAGPRRLARGPAGEGEAGTEREAAMDVGAYAFAVHFALVRDIRPDDWRESGGEGGEIFTAPTHLVIRTDAATHERIAAWMARLDGMAMEEQLAFLLQRGEYEPGRQGFDEISDGP